LSPEQAYELADAYVAEHRSYCRVSILLEDADDYLVCTESDGPIPAGPGPILISKTTSQVWTLGSAEGGNPRWDTMQPVRRPAGRQPPVR
jgi:hypothetical protein